MKKIYKYRYYCDFCKKSGASAGHMKKHEKSCTANPNRICGFCGFPTDVKSLVSALGDGDNEGVKRLREEAEGCPACMLSAIRQSGLQRAYVDEEDKGFSVGFNFQAEKKEWWDERRQPAYGNYSNC